jgi:hypothetical protein
MSTLSDFQTLTLTRLAAAAKTARLRRDMRDNLLSNLYPALPGEVFESGTDLTIPDVPELTHVAGVARADLTPDALERHEAYLLQKFRMNVYLRLQGEWGALNGPRASLPHDVIVSVLEDLGLPQPEKTTRVEADVKGHGQMIFTLDGEVGDDVVRERLTTIGSDPVQDALAGAFAGVAAVTRKPLVRSTYVTPQITWPKLELWDAAQAEAPAK